MKMAQLKGRHQAFENITARNWMNTTTNQKNTRGDVSRDQFAKLPAELTDRLDSRRVRLVKQQKTSFLQRKAMSTVFFSSFRGKAKYNSFIVAAKAIPNNWCSSIAILQCYRLIL